MHIYTTTELKAIRESLREPLKSFRQKVDEWCIIFNSAEDKTAGHSFFVANIIPWVNETNNFIQNHPVMKHHYNLFGGYKSYVMMGETTKELLLNYYLYYDFINEEKYSKIKESCVSENYRDRRIPIIYTSVHQTPTFPSITEFEDLNMVEDLKTIRKFITLD